MSRYTPKDGCRTIWMKVTSDELELPVAVADTAEQLAQMCGTTVGSIYSSVSKAKHGRETTSYRKVRVKL